MAKNKDNAKNRREIPEAFIKERSKISERFLAVRLEHGGTRRQFADELSNHGLTLSETSISRYESGENNIPIDVLYVLHRYFHIDLNQLLCGDETPSTNNATAIKLANNLIEVLKNTNSNADR